MLLREALTETSSFRVDDEVNVTLTMQRHILTAMPSHDRKPETLEQRSQQSRIRRGVFDELEAVRTHGIVYCRDLRGSGLCMSTHNSLAFGKSARMRLHTSRPDSSIRLQWMVTIETIRVRAVNKDPT